MMKAEKLFFRSCTILCGILSLQLHGLDQDFTVIGNSTNGPTELSLFRRANGYAVFVQSSNSANKVKVYFDCDNSVKTGEPQGCIGAEYCLHGDGKVEKYKSGKWTVAGRVDKVLSSKEYYSFFIPDKMLSITENSQIGAVCIQNGSKTYLPDESNGSLLATGSKKSGAFNWNRTNRTILKQVHNTKAVFHDPQGDIINAECDDLISGTVEVRAGKLYLQCCVAAPFKGNLKIWIDSLPSAGYGLIEADYMIDGRNLLRYAGKNSGKWLWEKIMTVELQKSGNEIRCELPLELVRPHKYGRLRICFQTGQGMEKGDVMPSRGKVLPVLRPGNLASAADTKIETSCIYPKYKIYPLTDGQTATQIYYEYEAWASSDENGKDKFADFIFTKKEAVRHLAVWWVLAPQEIEILGKNGEQWNLLIAKKIDPKDSYTEFSLPENCSAEAIRIKMKAGKGNKSRPNLLWIREVEIY